VLSRNLEKSLHRALACANERRHEYATLEHLLLSLTEDPDAVAVLRACRVDVERLGREVLSYVDELASLITDCADDAKPTPSFQRVLQRAATHVQSSEREEVTGADILAAILAERETPAVYFLQQQDMSQFDVVNYISHGIAKAPRSSERRLPFPGVRQTPAFDETKIIAAILCAGAILPDDVAVISVGKTVDLYERILAELCARGRRGTTE